MPIEFKTLIFPNTETGRQEKIRQLEWYANQNWEIVSENITPGQIKGQKACLLAAICLPLVFMAGVTDGEIIITIRRGGIDTETSSAHNDLSPLHDKDKNYAHVPIGDINSLIKRAFLFIEDGQFDNAEFFLNQALNQDTENARIHFGLLMCIWKAHNTSELVSKIPALIENEKLFQRALSFADEDYRKQLEGLAQASRNKAEQARLHKEAEQKRKQAEAEARREKITALKDKASQIMGETKSAIQSVFKKPDWMEDKEISQVQSEQAQTSASELTRKGIEAVKKSQFQQAIQFFDRALERNPENYNAYMGKLMAVRNAANNNELVRNSINLAVPIEEEELFKKASECATPKQKELLDKIVKAIRANKKR